MTSQSPSHSPWTFWQVVWATLVLVAVGLSFWLLYRFHQALFILFIAVIMGTVPPFYYWPFTGRATGREPYAPSCLLAPI